MPTCAHQGIPARGKTKPNPSASLPIPLTAHTLSVVYVLCLFYSPLSFSHFVRRFLVKSLENHVYTALLLCASFRLPFPLDTIVAIQMSKNKTIYMYERERERLEREKKQVLVLLHHFLAPPASHALLKSLF